MFERFHGLKAVAAVLIGLLLGLLGGWDKPLQLLATLVVLDWVSGVLARSVTGRVNSSIGWRGIMKKVGYGLAVALAHTTDQLAVAPAVTAAGGLLDPLVGSAPMRSVVVLMLAGNEGISIIENLGEMGVPIPAFLRNAMEKLSRRDAA